MTASAVAFETPSPCTVESNLEFVPRDNRHNHADPSGFGTYGSSLRDGFRMRQDDEYVDNRPLSEKFVGFSIIED